MATPFPEGVKPCSALIIQSNLIASAHFVTLVPVIDEFAIYWLQSEKVSRLLACMLVHGER